MAQISSASSCARAGWSRCALALALCSGAGLVAVAPVLAQDRFAGDSFAAAPVVPDSILSLWGSRTLEPRRWALMLDGSYARSPLTLIAGRDDDEIADLVGSISTLELMATVGFLDRFDVTLALPVHHVSAGSELDDGAPAALQAATIDESSMVFGDIRVVPRLKLVGPEPGENGVGLALLVPLWLPTGDDEHYAGENFRIEPRIALDFAVGKLKLAVNAGYLIRSEAVLLGATIDDMVSWGVGTAIQVVEPLSLVAELSGHLNVDTDDFGDDDAPTELLGALRLAAGSWLVQLGGGAGLVGGVTEPAWRLLAGVGYLSPLEPTDRDGDGLYDYSDRCQTEPEDRDGFEDEDGCPDPDNDRDGLPDLRDRCPNDAEDADGFEDQDGCPELDNDRDGNADRDDACPDTAGERSDDRTKNGCPDRDHDTVFDAEDACPDVPGVRSEDPTTNGCPKPAADRDGDGIPDAEDACPDAAGPASPLPRANGCPKARIEQGQIKILERVEFATNSAQLLAPSDEVLRAVHGVLVENTSITKLSIEGHTDNVGTDAYNQRLSQKRARAVRDWLIAQGFAKERLEAKGVGESRPIETNDTDEGRTSNRRVEFHILQIDGAPAQAPAAATP